MHLIHNIAEKRVKEELPFWQESLGKLAYVTAGGMTVSLAL